MKGMFFFSGGGGTVESNDRLYIGDEEFQIQIGQNCAAILTELLNDLKSLGTSHQHRQQVYFYPVHRFYYFHLSPIYQPLAGQLFVQCGSLPSNGSFFFFIDHLNDFVKSCDYLSWPSSFFPSLTQSIVNVRRFWNWASFRSIFLLWTI